MQAEIIKIDKPVNSASVKGKKYIRVYFKILETGKFAKTDLVMGFRNFKRWKPYLKVGNVLDNLRLKDEKTIDADSFPILRRHPELPLEEEKWIEFAKNYLS